MAEEQLYGARWQRARARFLACHPLCHYCSQQGLPRVATVVDHITPHKGNHELFWDPDNWQALCKRCHDQKTARQDGGFGRDPSTKGHDSGGFPTSPHHPWAKIDA